MEVVIENTLHVHRPLTCRHRQYSSVFLNHNYISVLIHKLHITALEEVVSLGFAYRYLHAWLQQEVELGNGLAVNLYSSTLKRRLSLGTALLQICQKPLQKRGFGINCVLIVLWFRWIIMLHNFNSACKSTHKYSNSQIVGILWLYENNWLTLRKVLFLIMKRLFLIIAMALFTGTNLFAKDKKVVLRIVETSDVHGAFFPYDFITREPRAGSIARISTYVNKLRKKYGDNLLLFENGDILQGQPTCYFYNYINTKEENIAASVVNYLRYDAQTFGNHDVETGHAVYDKWMKEVKCPVIGANIIDKSTGESYVKPYIMLKRNGVRIAVIGLLTPAIPNWLTEDLWSGLRFDEMVSSARHWMKIVREKEKADVVIGLFHSGKDGGITTSKYEEDASERVAREVPGFDLVLFGHDHTRHNDRVVNTEGQEVLCLDPANNALSVAEATISITLHKGKVVAKRVSGTVADGCSAGSGERRAADGREPGRNQKTGTGQAAGRSF